MTPESPAALLRRAAARLDEVAGKVSGTRWSTVLDDDRGLVYTDVPRWPGETGMGRLAVAYESNRGDITEGDATWMGTMGPQVAAPLSSWLRAMAPDVEWRYDTAGYREALAFARLVLGETEKTP